MKTVQVKFPQTPHNYEYYLLPGQEATEGTYVVVDSPYNGYTVVKVVKTVLEGKATKAVVAVVDDKQYLEYQKNEARRQAIVKELEKLAKREDEKLKYRWLAQNNAEASALLNELERL